MGQLGVPEWDVIQLSLDPVDDSAKGTQRFVDELGLLQNIAFDLALLDAFTSREVHQHQRTISHLICSLVDSFQPKSNDEMGSAGAFILVGKRSLSISFCFPQMSLHWVDRKDLDLLCLVHSRVPLADEINDAF